jgi:hypothetical protein
MSYVSSFRRFRCEHGFLQRPLSLLPVLAARFFHSRRDLLLLELGRGFAFVGSQIPLEVDGQRSTWICFSTMSGFIATSSSNSKRLGP